MGEYADERLDHMLGPYMPDQEPDYTHWMTSAGKYLAISDMSSQHLYNTIAMLKRNGNGEGYVDAMEKELRRREDANRRLNTRRVAERL